MYALDKHGRKFFKLYFELPKYLPDVFRKTPMWRKNQGSRGGTLSPPLAISWGSAPSRIVAMSPM